MNVRKLALLAAFLATVIYGVNYTIAKDVMPLFIKPFGFIILRVSGAMVLFWILGFFVKKEKIDKKDVLNILLAATFGASLNMLTFFKGLSLTTPINASVIMVMVPIMVFGLSILFLKERLLKHRIIGLVLGFLGAIVLITYGKQQAPNAPHIVLGNMLIFCNATLYAFYLIIVKKLLAKYHPFTFVKWIYFFGFLIVLPFGWHEFTEIQWTEMPSMIWYKMLFVVVCTTFLTYLLNLLALTKLKPTTVSSFVYLQPVIATLFALWVKSDALNPVNMIGAIFIFVGVYLVSKPAKNMNKQV